MVRLCVCVRLSLHGDDYIAVLEGGDKYKSGVLARRKWKAPNTWPFDLLLDKRNVYHLPVPS